MWLLKRFSQGSDVHSLSDLYCNCESPEVAGMVPCTTWALWQSAVYVFASLFCVWRPHQPWFYNGYYILHFKYFLQGSFWNTRMFISIFHSDYKSGSLPTHFWEVPQCRLCLRRNMGSRTCTKYLNLISSFRSVCTWLHEAKPRKILSSEAW